MDCVECDKCRLWGKLQVCVLFSVLKLLLTLNFCTEKLKVFVTMSSLFIELETQSVVLLFYLWKKLVCHVYVYKVVFSVILG